MPKPYRPSNGTEGDFFMEDFCYRCKNDSEDNPCPIIGRTMGYDIDDIRYPTEWICDDDRISNPRCTAFEARHDDKE